VAHQVHVLRVAEAALRAQIGLGEGRHWARRCAIAINGDDIAAINRQQRWGVGGPHTVEAVSGYQCHQRVRWQGLSTHKSEVRIKQLYPGELRKIPL